jgi:hypothetical protein
VSKRAARKKPSTRKVIGEALDHLVFVFREAVKRPRQRAAAAGGVLLFVAAMLLARRGTLGTRAAAGVLLVGPWVAAAVVLWRERRSWDDPRVAIGRLAGGIAPERAARALRALSLLDDDGDAPEGTSPILARLHLARQLEALPRDQIIEWADRLGRRYHLGALGLLACGLGLVATNPWGVVEGADILPARGGVAPLGLTWVYDVELVARPPDYLHMDESTRRPFGELSLPRGTLLTFRGTPAHDGRRLLLSDGKSDVPFVDDGSGKVVARWPLAESASLRIVARFGNVNIQEPDATEVTSIPDEVPIVTLEGAPKRFELATQSADIPIRYEAKDDHGLREVHLVLRSGAREERRVLARLDGETRQDRGGTVLRPTDPFLKRSHAPIEVRVEAKDNDPITGPKWGASEPITLLPPDVGEPEAARLTALRKLRDAHVDTLAWRLAHEVPKAAVAQKAFLDEEQAGAKRNTELMDDILMDTYAGVRVPSRLVALLRGQQKKLTDALDKEVRGPSTATHAAYVKASETMVLVIDGVVRGLGYKDARDAGKQLAEVADDLALGLMQIVRPAEASRGVQRTDAAHIVLDGGQRQLHTLGPLGRDLGGVIVADLFRVDRARKEDDLLHAELAARDLAARLREPDPSFGSKGSGGRAGGESGGAKGTPSEGDQGEASEAERAFAEAAQELEQLTQDHAGQIGKVEQALNNAASEDDLKALREQGKQRADAVREAVKNLPSVGGGSDSWTSKGSAAKELGEQMAHSLEQGDPADAVQSGRAALQAIDEAKRISARERWRTFGDPAGQDADKRLDDAKKKLDPEVRAAEDALEQLRKKAAQRASGDLQKGGAEEEGLADRARKLGDKSRDKGALPGPAIDALQGAEDEAREASRALKEGDADRALQHQREAQRKLEQAKEALGEGEQPQSEGDDGNATSQAPVDIPKADAHKGPEDFRRRVIKGLGQPADARHKDAVKRYAEGLLR